MNKQTKDTIEEKITKLVEYEDGRNDEQTERGIVRKDMGRKAQIILVVNEIMTLVEQVERETREDLLNNGYKHLPIQDKITMFGSALGLIMNQLAKEAKTNEVESNINHAEGILNIKYNLLNKQNGR